MPDQVRHDTRGNLLFKWVPRLRSYPSSAATLLWRVKRHRGVSMGFITPSPYGEGPPSQGESYCELPRCFSYRGESCCFYCRHTATLGTLFSNFDKQLLATATSRAAIVALAILTNNRYLQIPTTWVFRPVRPVSMRPILQRSRRRVRLSTWTAIRAASMTRQPPTWESVN